MRLLAAVMAIIMLFATPVAAHTYTVKSGDTLSEIAAANGMSTARLASLNGISNPSRIRTGQVLQLHARVHVVQRGEALSVIATRYGVSLSNLASTNSISNPSRIFPGQRLTLPTSSGRSYANLPRTLTSRPERMALIPIFEREAARYGVPVSLLMAVGFQESGWRQSATNTQSTAVGVGQILVGTAGFINRVLVSPDQTRHTASGNIRMMSAYLGWLIRQFNSERLGTAAYYQGIGSIQRNGIQGFTHTYLANVDEHRRNLFS